MSAGDTVKIKLDAGGFKVGVIIDTVNNSDGTIVYVVRYHSDAWGETTGFFRAARLESCSP